MVITNCLGETARAHGSVVLRAVPERCFVSGKKYGKAKGNLRLRAKRREITLLAVEYGGRGHFFSERFSARQIRRLSRPFMSLAL